MSENDSKEEATELENEFRQVVNQHKMEIDAKVKEASDALSEACSIADKYGIPFTAGISHISQSYVPKSFENKFSDLPAELVEELTEVYDTEYAYGWQHSAVC